MPNHSHYPKGIRAEAADWIVKNYFQFLFSLFRQLLNTNQFEPLLEELSQLNSEAISNNSQEYDLWMLVYRSIHLSVCSITELSLKQIGKIHRTGLRTDDISSFENQCPIEDFGLAAILSESGIFDPLSRNLSEMIKWLVFNNWENAKKLAGKISDYDQFCQLASPVWSKENFFENEPFSCPAKTFVLIGEKLSIMLFVLIILKLNYAQLLNAMQFNLLSAKIFDLPAISFKKFQEILSQNES